MPTDPETQINYPLKAFFVDIWAYTSGFHRRLIFWLTIRGIAPSVSLLNPVITAMIIDRLTGHTATTLNLWWLLFLFLLINLVRIFFRNRANYFINRLENQIRLQIRQRGISRLLDFDLSWHEKQASGKKVTIITRGSDALRDLIKFIRSGGGGIDIFINIVVVLIIFATLDWRYFLVAIANVVSYLYVNHLSNQVLNPQKHSLNIDYERVMSKNFEYFSNMNLIKSLGIGHQVNKTLFLKENEYTDRSIKVSKYDFDRWLYINYISQFFSVVITAMVVFDIFAGRITLGSFFIYTGYITRLQDGLGGIADWVTEVIDDQLAFYRMIQLLGSGSTKTNCGSKTFPSPLHSISFNNVHFRYPKAKVVTLKGVSFEINAGEKIGIVGQSGSGKSTITKLLLRLYLVNRGAICYNHINLNHISPAEIRRSIAVAPQDSEIFNLTFKENITIASESITPDQRLYQQALNTAECQPILEKIKNNHQALLGEKGVKLSGGERQRLGIARAVYKNSSLMIFDESTSSLDSKTEEKILTNVENNLKSKTILWIAHRLSTLRFTDRIIVFDQGKIVETGSFKELIAKKGHFYQLWQIQKRTKLK